MQGTAGVHMSFYAAKALQVDNAANSLVVKTLQLFKIANVFGKQGLQLGKYRRAAMALDNAGKIIVKEAVEYQGGGANDAY